MKNKEGIKVLFFSHLLLNLRNEAAEAPLPLLWVQLGVVVQGLHDDKVVAHLVSQAWEKREFGHSIHPLHQPL